MLVPIFGGGVNNEKSLYFLNDRILVNVKEFGHIGRAGSVFLVTGFRDGQDLEDGYYVLTGE